MSLLLPPSLGVMSRNSPLNIQSEKCLRGTELPHRLWFHGGFQALTKIMALDFSSQMRVLFLPLSVWIHLDLLSLIIVIIPGIHFVKVY